VVLFETSAIKYQKHIDYEAQLLKRLSHPNIVKYLDHDSVHGWLKMEACSPTSLDDRGISRKLTFKCQLTF